MLLKAIAKRKGKLNAIRPTKLLLLAMGAMENSYCNIGKFNNLKVQIKNYFAIQISHLKPSTGKGPLKFSR